MAQNYGCRNGSLRPAEERDMILIFYINAKQCLTMILLKNTEIIAKLSTLLLNKP